MSYLAAPAPRARAPRLYFAAALALGLAALVWTYVVFAAGSPVPEFDRECALFWRDRDAQAGFWWELMVFLTDIGGVAAMALLVGMGAIWQWSAHHYRLALAWIAAALGGGMIDMALKETLARPRPPTEWRDRAVLQNTRSYPSGHSLGSAINYGMLAYALGRGPVRHGRRWVARAFWLALFPLGYLWPGWWLWAILGVVAGRGRLGHPTVIAPDRHLDARRRAIGWVAIALFVLTFAPIPVPVPHPF